MLYSQRIADNLCNLYQSPCIAVDLANLLYWYYDCLSCCLSIVFFPFQVTLTKPPHLMRVKQASNASSCSSDDTTELSNNRTPVPKPRQSRSLKGPPPPLAPRPADRSSLPPNSTTHLWCIYILGWRHNAYKKSFHASYCKCNIQFTIKIHFSLERAIDDAETEKTATPIDKYHIPHSLSV